MRLFNRRREMEFDDPRLVGISVLKTTEEGVGGIGSQSQQNQPTPMPSGISATATANSVNFASVNLNLPTLNEGLLTLRRSNTNANTLGLGAQQPDKLRMTNGVSTWKRVARPWDSLRRSESTEHLSRSVMSSATNRRKTLHFYPEFDGKNNDKSLLQFPQSRSGSICSAEQTSTANSTSGSTSTLTPPKRKIGRVESLRLLLSKSNKIYRGKNASKQDKGTDTQDLENDVENYNSSHFSHPDHDELFHSKYSSLSSLKSDSYLTPLPSKNFRNRFQIMKTTSCENLNLVKNGNQGITHRDMSTSTTNTFSTFTDSSSCLSQSGETTTTKRSSFPYAYIRSRLSSLQEEPKPLSMSVRSARASNDPNLEERQKCSLATNFMHKGFYHSMGNLLSESKEEGHRSEVDGDIEGDVDEGDSQSNSHSPNSPVQGAARIFDPLKQIRIDLLHRNPSESEIDDQSPSPTFWGRRSYSIGDMLEKRKVAKTDSGNGKEESGYDSDSTRNGHESPRNSVKSPSSETENDLNESEQCVITDTSSSGTEGENPGECQPFDSDSQSQSNNSESSACSSSSRTSRTSNSSMYSFPASGCLITINQMPSTPREVSVNGFRKAEDGSIVEVTTEIDQTEDVDFYSATSEGALESSISTNTKNKTNNGTGTGTFTRTTTSTSVNGNVKTENPILKPSQQNSLKSSSNVLVNACSPGGGSISKTHFSRREKTTHTVNSDKDKETPCTTSVVSINEKTDAVSDSQKTEKTAPSLRLRNRVRDRDREWNSIKPSRSKSLCLSIFTVNFYKGPNKKSLGFSVIGGKDSPVPGIFVKRIFAYGQASEEGGLTEGDEILSVNGQPLANSTHAEALQIFKLIKAGDVVLEVARREFMPTHSQTLKRQYSQLSSKSCEQLHQAY